MSTLLFVEFRHSWQNCQLLTCKFSFNKSKCFNLNHNFFCLVACLPLYPAHYRLDGRFSFAFVYSLSSSYFVSACDEANERNCAKSNLQLFLSTDRLAVHCSTDSQQFCLQASDRKIARRGGRPCLAFSLILDSLVTLNVTVFFALGFILISFLG